jgi:hypothetical protein
MERDQPQDGTLNAAVPLNAAPDKQLTPAARRALHEAAERRENADALDQTLLPEQGGPKGLEPTRFGDWERGGLIRDF